MNNSDNWMRYFEHMILNELQSLNSFNFTVNRESIDTNEFNVRFEIETRILPLFNFSASHGHGEWSLQFGSITTTSPSTIIGLSHETIEQNSTKYIICTDTECHICLDTLLQGSCMRRLNNCNHSYCIDCIDTWLQNHNSCPVCKCHITTASSSSSLFH